MPVESYTDWAGDKRYKVIMERMLAVAALAVDRADARNRAKQCLASALSECCLEDATFDVSCNKVHVRAVVSSPRANFRISLSVPWGSS